MSRFVTVTLYVNMATKHVDYVHGTFGVCGNIGYREE